MGRAGLCGRCLWTLCESGRVPSSSCFGVPLEGLSKPTVRKQGQRKEGIVVPDSESRRSPNSPAPNAEKRKSKATETPAREADSDQERLMMNVLPLSSVLEGPSSSKRPGEHSGVVRVAVRIQKQCHFSDQSGGRENEQHCLCGAQEFMEQRALWDWLIVSCKGLLASERDLPGHVGTWKSIARHNKILGIWE